MNNDKIVETTVLHTHQSFNNGGISMDVVRKEVFYEILGSAKSSVSFDLKASVSNYGVRQETNIPLTAESVEMLEEILKVLKDSDIEKSNKHLAIRKFVTYEDGSEKYDYKSTYGECGQASQVQVSSPR